MSDPDDGSRSYRYSMKLQSKALEYTYRIHWSPDQHGYVASVAEFPAIQSPPEDTPHAAVEKVVASVVGELRTLDLDGQSMPLSLAANG